MKFTCILTDGNNGTVTGLNRGATAGELEGTCSPQELTHGFDHRYYKVVDLVFTPMTWPEKEAVDAEKTRESLQRQNKEECKEVILSLYPLTIQSSINMGIYPAAEAEKAREWIAAMIEEENRVYDALAAALDVPEMETVMAGRVWPDVNDYPVEVI